MSGVPEQLPLTVAGRAPPSLDNFLGAANAEVRARLRALVGSSGGRIWLTGGTGSGKSHLLSATSLAARAAQRTVLDNAATAAALRAAIDGHVEIVLLDDADAIAGVTELEALLMQLCNEQAGALVLAGRLHPAAAAWQLPDLRSRLLAAEVFRLAPLDDADRRELLVGRAADVGLELEDDVLAYLLSRLPRDSANLLASMNRLDLASWRAQRRLTVPFVRDVLALNR